MERDVGLDAHAKSCTFGVISERGRRLKSGGEANGRALIEFVKRVPGRTHLCLEEGETERLALRGAVATCRRDRGAAPGRGQARAQGRRDRCLRTEGQGKRRNGKYAKTVRTGQGPIEVEVPRDREGSFEPQPVPKRQRHFDGFDDKILSMCARGMTTREIRAHLAEIYGVGVSPDLISHVTDAVFEEMTAWQSRPLERVYLVAYLDALVIKVRDMAQAPGSDRLLARLGSGSAQAQPA